jgi:uncharacterized membrane protein
LSTKTNKTQFLPSENPNSPDNPRFTSSSQIYLIEKQETLNPKTDTSLQSFFKTNSSNYMITLILAVTSMATVFVFQNSDNLLRNFSGLLLTLGLPGYALMNALFLPKTFGFERQGQTGWLLTGVFSVVLSIIMVSLVGFALDLSPLGVTLTSLNLSLFSLTLFFGTIGFWRRYRTIKFAK